ncbi:DUF4926 domain-containing protein [Brevundimonas sp.]|uniref:DUF4926 domain-containing protein n=1 Tax=Brevundimonas sp. TaxID=1871086 RepID=UPI0025BA1903|nr:DUF4926 domain-containing protein [Brevundimonas sp.]
MVTAHHLDGIAMFVEFDAVRLLIDVPELGLKRGMVGTVLMIHTGPSLAYEVEFMEAEGDTFAVQPNDIESASATHLQA